MKQIISLAGIQNTTRIALLAALLWLVIPLNLTAQTDTATQQTDTAAQKEEAVAEEEPSLISPSVEFIGVQKGDNTISLTATLKAKVKTNFYTLRLLKVTFFHVTDTGDNELGFVITDKNGVARYTVKAEGLKASKDSSLHFKAVFAGNKSMEAAEELVAMRKAKLEITPVKEDSLLTIQVKLTDEGTGQPVAGATVGIFVKRLFKPLKVGEGVTDENGEVIVEIPAGLPGDAKGNLTFYGRLDEHEQYGNLEATAVEKWGVPVSDKIEDQPRTLWSEHPPVWMLVTFIVLMVAVWGHYIVIVFELFRLRKEQPHVSET